MFILTIFVYAVSHNNNLDALAGHTDVRARPFNKRWKTVSTIEAEENVQC